MYARSMRYTITSADGWLVALQDRHRRRKILCLICTTDVLYRRLHMQMRRTQSSMMRKRLEHDHDQ